MQRVGGWEAFDGLLHVDNTAVRINILDHGRMKMIHEMIYGFLFNDRQGFWCSDALPPDPAARSGLLPVSPSL